MFDVFSSTKSFLEIAITQNALTVNISCYIIFFSKNFLQGIFSIYLFISRGKISLITALFRAMLVIRYNSSRISHNTQVTGPMVNRVGPLVDLQVITVGQLIYPRGNVKYIPGARPFAFRQLS